MLRLLLISMFLVCVVSLDSGEIRIWRHIDSQIARNNDRLKTIWIKKSARVACIAAVNGRDSRPLMLFDKAV